MQGVVVGDPGDDEDRDGPADLRGAPRDGVVLRRRRRRRSRSAAARRTGPASGSRRRSSRRARPTDRVGRRGGVRPGRRRACRSTTRPTPIRIANDTEYGLSGSIWTRDVGRALRVARGVEAGNLSVNSHSSVRYWTPFGGFKQSGLGRELGPGRAGRLHRDQERLHRDGGVRAEMVQASARAGSPSITGGGQRHRARLGAAVRRARAPTVVVADLDTDAGEAARRGGRRRCSSRCDVTDEAAVEALFAQAAADLRLGRHRVQQRRHLAARRRLHPGHRARRVGQGAARSTSPRCTCAASTRSRTCSAQGKGSIINTASFVAVMGAATSQISYTASKGGVLAMTRELGVQFAREGIRVNALCPGPVNTPLLQELFAKDPERAAAAAGARADGPVRRAGRRSPPPWRSSPATTRRSSPRRRSWSTAASRAPTSPRSEAAT